MATKVYTVKAPDGTSFKIRGPEGASQEEIIGQAQALWAQKQQAPAPAPDPDAQLKADQAARGTTLSSLIGQGSELANQYAPLTMLARGAEAVAPETLAGLGKSVGDFQSGVVSGAGGLLEGGRQLFNKMTGDKEELAQLNQDTEMRRRKLAELTKDNPTLTNIGEVIGEAGPTIASGGALAAATAPVKMGALARVLGGTVGGGLQGGMAALTPQEEAAGERGSRAGVGAALGAAGGLVGPLLQRGATRFAESRRNALPDVALKDFMQKTTGITDDTAKTYENILGKTRGETERIRNLSDANYEDALVHEWEKSGNIGFPLHGVDRLFVPASKDLDEVTAGTREIMNSSDAVADMFMAANTSGTKTVDVPTALQGIKDLNKFANDPEMAKTARLTAESLARDLRKQTELLSGMLPEMKAITDKHDVAQDFWNTRLRPMTEAGPGQPIGTWMDEGGGSQKAFEDTFLSGQSGQQLKDLFDRVPGVESDVRKMWGTTRMNQPEIARELAPSTTRDLMIQDPAARKYATMLSGALRGGGSNEGVNAAQKLAGRFSGRYAPMVNFILPEKMARGVHKFGEPGKKRFTSAEKMAAALRASALLNAIQPQYDVEPIGGQ